MNVVNRNQSLRLTRSLAAVSVVALSVIGAAGAAQASTAAPTTKAMTATGFDEKTAEQHGYHWISPDTGSPYVISQKDYNSCNANATNMTVRAACYSSREQASPGDIVGGNCGLSYLFLSGSSGTYPLTLYYNTGFEDLREPAIAYDWLVSVYTPSSSELNFTWHGTLLASSSWDSGTSADAVTEAGEYDGYAEADGSHAYLIDGTICSAANPYSYTTVVS